MRRFSVLLSVIGLMVLGTVFLGAQPGAIAQEATPAGDDMMMEGITYEPVSFGLGVDLASPSDLFVARIGFDPGMGFPINESDPSTGLLLVESGTITVQVDGPVTVTRGASISEAMMNAETPEELASAAEVVAAGEAVTLEAGDAAYIPASINGELRNDGEERAVGLAFLVVPADEMMGSATPAP